MGGCSIDTYSTPFKIENLALECSESDNMHIRLKAQSSHIPCKCRMKLTTLTFASVISSISLKGSGRLLGNLESLSASPATDEVKLQWEKLIGKNEASRLNPWKLHCCVTDSPDVRAHWKNGPQKNRFTLPCSHLGIFRLYVKTGTKKWAGIANTLVAP